MIERPMSTAGDLDADLGTFNKLKKRILINFNMFYRSFLNLSLSFSASDERDKRVSDFWLKIYNQKRLMEKPKIEKRDNCLWMSIMVIEWNCEQKKENTDVKEYTCGTLIRIKAKEFVFFSIIYVITPIRTRKDLFH